jgi:diacylglycerol kinase (ATP)
MVGEAAAWRFETLGPERDWVGIAANASSGMGQGQQRVQRLVAELGRLGFKTRVAWTNDERVDLVAQTHQGAHWRCLVAAGGDGTVAALVNEQPDVPVTVLPVGTENLFSRHFRLGRSPESLAATIAAGRVVPLDVGLAAGRRFVLMAGIGFDADVVTRHHVARMSRAGRMRPTHRGAYVEPVLRSSFQYRFPPLTIKVTDPGREETLVGASAFLFNLPRYALGLPFAPSARGDDGLLDLVVFRHPGAWRALHYLWLVLRGLHLRRSDVEHRRIAGVSVTSVEAAPVQLDGDPAGLVGDASPVWSAKVLPRAVSVVVPAAYRH